MKYTMLFILAISFLACKKDKDCKCRSLEICKNGVCVLKENAYYIDNHGIEGYNLFLGAVNGNVCIDTIAIDINPTASSSHYFTLYASVYPVGVIALPVEIIKKLSTDEYILGCGLNICNPTDSTFWYPSWMRCKIYDDSVSMKIKFRQQFDTMDRFVDSCQVTFLK